MRKNRKELIRETAIEVMAECGFHNSTTDKIAEHAQIAVGTIYNYFRNKEEILEYIFAVELKKRQEAYNEQMQNDAPALKKLCALLELHFAEIAKDIRVGRILVREQQLRGDRKPNEISAFLQGVPHWIQALLDLALKQGEIRLCNTRILAAGIFGAIQGVAANAVFEEDKRLQKQILENAATELMNLCELGISMNR